MARRGRIIGGSSNAVDDVVFAMVACHRAGFDRTA